MHCIALLYMGVYGCFAYDALSYAEFCLGYTLYAIYTHIPLLCICRHSGFLVVTGVQMQ